VAGTVLVAGSAGLDTVEGPTGRADDVLGGSAVYFAAAASVFAPVRLVTVVGGDFPEEGFARLRARGVDLSGVEVVPGGRTFRWHGRYSEDMNDRDTVSVELNVLASFEPKLPASFTATPFAFLANGPTATQHSVLDQMDPLPFAGADTMNLWIGRERDELLRLLRRVEVLFVNESEARMLTGKASLWDAGREILRMGPRTVVVKKIVVPAYPVERLVDPTGAGDSFAGGFLGYLAGRDRLRPGDLRGCLVHASAVASFTCESFGPERLLSVSREEVEERVAFLREIARL
jgi:sugar/nucleoside kinase (ribokinase family)